MFAPTHASDETKKRYQQEHKCWPHVSQYKTPKRITKRINDIKTILKSPMNPTRRLRLKNEFALLVTKRSILSKPIEIQSMTDASLTFLRFLWGSELLLAETAEERQRAREHETTLLMEVYFWVQSMIQKQHPNPV